MPNVKIVKTTVQEQVDFLAPIPFDPNFRKFKKDLPKEERKLIEKQKREKKMQELKGAELRGEVIQKPVPKKREKKTYQ